MLIQQPVGLLFPFALKHILVLLIRDYTQPTTVISPSSQPHHEVATRTYQIGPTNFWLPLRRESLMLKCTYLYNDQAWLRVRCKVDTVDTHLLSVVTC